MSSSATKDRCTVIGLHPVPAHLSTKEFAAQIEAVVDSHLALPVAQKRLVTDYELFIPSDRFDSHLMGLGFPQPRPVVIVKAKCETAEHCAQFFRDADVIQSIGGETFAGARIFCGDEFTKIDNNARSTDGSGNWVAIFKCPPGVSATQWTKEWMNGADGFVALPAMQRNILKHTVWVQNESVAGDFQTLGIAPPEPMIFVLTEGDLDPMIEVLTDSGVKTHFGGKDKTVTGELSNRFAVDVIKKV
ncbi:hypothetical protein K438DRAFT_652480 [Mycena galopus ATCC 62051]|nr:hypothetical protein K438DRAFT_652480 [Mycena galopus ATCC 62051]